MELSSITNIIYSDNPFLIRRMFDEDDHSKNVISENIINIKYWYSSMPVECKIIFKKIIEDKTFEIHRGTFLRLTPEEVDNWGGFDKWRPSRLLYSSLGSEPKPKTVADDFSEALRVKKLLPPECYPGSEFSIVDPIYDLVFKITTREIALIDKFGEHMVVLNAEPKHALLLYSAIRGVQSVKDNIKSWEVMKYQNSLKDKILEVYNGTTEKKNT